MSCQQITGTFLFAVCFGSAYLSSPLSAQIVPDNTLGNENSLITPNASVKDSTADLIEGGAIRENNLFHSFSEFNVSGGNSVYFANPDGIANIITRVTGNNISEIFGTLGIDGTANLFLLNPNGIVFGEHAALDVNSSFFATTADSFIFINEFAYGAADPDIPPLLTVNLPVGVQFGDRTNTISIKGHEDHPEFDFAEDVESESLFEDSPELYFSNTLGVLAEKNITLIGGNLEFEAGELVSPNSVINLGSVAPNSLIKILPTNDHWTLDYEQVSEFQDIFITQDTTIASSGDSAGEINIQADEVELKSSAIYADAFEKDGDAGDINFKVQSLSLDGSELASNSLGDGNSGNISIQADEVELKSSVIYADSYEGGNAGDIYLSVQSLNLLEDSFVTSNSQTGNGGGGDISILADDVELKSSVIYADSYGEGNAGNIYLSVQSLSLESSELASNSFGDGDSGNISIQADEVELKFSDIYVDSYGTSGNSGNISFNVKSLSLLDGSEVASNSFELGNGGNIVIQADEVELKGFGEIEDEDGLFILSSNISAESYGAGNAGDISLNVESLSLADEAEIATSTFGTGDGGNISIQADSIEINGIVDLAPEFYNILGSGSGIYSEVGEYATGNGGTITLQVAQDLRILHGGKVQTNTSGAGNAGDIRLDAAVLELSGFSLNAAGEQSLSQISALSASDADAGSVIINSNFVEISDRGNISVSNLGDGNSGELNITSSKLDLDHAATIEATVNAGNQGNINLTTNNIFLNDQSEITATASGTSQGGNIRINNAENLVLLNNSQIIADAFEGMGGNIEITTQGYFVSGGSRISASSEFGLDGAVEVETLNSDRTLELAILPANLIEATEKITTGCNSNNNFALVGKGGLPENPTQFLAGVNVNLWQDLRLVALDSKILPVSDRQIKTTSTEPIVEIQGWQINHLGNLELIANNSAGVAQNNELNCRLFD